MGSFSPNTDRVENKHVPNTSVFLPVWVLLVTSSFHPFLFKRRLIIELICESAKNNSF